MKPAIAGLVALFGSALAWAQDAPPQPAAAPAATPAAAAEAGTAPVAPKKTAAPRPAYKWLELDYGFTYSGEGDFRARSETSYRLSANALLVRGLYAVGSFGVQEYNIGEPGNFQEDFESSQLSIGLGGYVPLEPRVHLIGQVTHEQTEEEFDFRDLDGAPPDDSGSGSDEFGGFGVLAGVRAVAPGAPELAVSYKWASLKHKDFSDVEATVGTFALFGAVPIARKVDVTLRIERTRTEFEFTGGSDTGYNEDYLVGLRFRI